MIDQNGENLGVVPTNKALQLARDANLDLVEIAASANPPVCKVLDLGKYIFEQNKKERLARKSQTKVEVKEIRLRPKTNEHHRMFKVRDARRWLESGMKVKVTIRFRGREVTYPEIALEDLREIAEELRDISTVETAPSMEGRSMTLVLAPSKSIPKKSEKTPAEVKKSPKEKESKAPQESAKAKKAKTAKEPVKVKDAKATKESSKESNKPKSTVDSKASKEPKTKTVKAKKPKE